MNAGHSKLQRVLTTLLAFCLSFSLSVPTQAIAFAREQIVGAGFEQTQESSAAQNAVTSAEGSVTGETVDGSTGGEKVDNGATSDGDSGVMMASESIALLAASDDGTTVKTNADFDFTKKWNDNNNEGNVRPGASNFAQNSVELYYKIDGAGEWTKLTTSNMGNVGLTEMPTPTYASNAGSVSYKYVLPSVIAVTSSGTSGESTSADKNVTWNYKEKAVEGYVDPVDEFHGNNSTIMNTLLSDWNASVLWGDNDNLYNSRVSATTVNNDPDTYFEVYRYVSGKPSTVEKLDAKTVGLTVSEKQDGTWKTEFSNAPAFDENGDPYVYYIVDKRNNDGASTLATNPAGIGDYLTEIRNVDNHATNTTELYENGTLQMVLDNMTEFKVTKKWEDGDETESRPNTKLYLYRISEGANHAIEDDAVSHANPVQGNDYQDISTSENVVVIDFPVDGTMLPMYDNQGHRYIYFALETGVTGDYKVVTDNTAASEDETVIAFFDKIKNSDGFAKYVLNGGTITNDREATQTITATKQFTAEALQEMENTAVQYTLYKKTADGWAPATKDDIVTENGVKLLGDNSTIAADGKIVTTIAGFKAEAMELSAAGPVVQKYDVDTGARMEYKYVETAMTVNGGEWVTVPSTIDADGNVTYQTVNVGVVAPGVGDQKTTVYFSPVQVDETTINNVLESDVLVTIEKVWTDSNGVNISGSQGDLDGVTCTFAIYRNGEVFQKVTLSLNDYNGTDEWFKQLSFDRYDANGLEYTWMIKEVGITDPQGRAWGQSFEYQTTVDEQAATGDMLLNRGIKYRNVVSVDPGYTLTFDVQKEWLDGSDTIAHAPVTYGLYDLVNKKLVSIGAAGTLSESNNWYESFSYAPESEDRVASEYVIVELAVDGVNVALTDDYDTIRAKAAAGKNVDVSNRIGTVGNPEAEDALYYVYNVYVSLQNEGETSAEYLIDNQRDATLNMKLTKNWNVGDSIANLNAKFFVYRDGEMFDLRDVTVELSGATLTADGGIQIAGSDAVDNKNTVKISGLDKFDNDGFEYHYALVESTLNGQVIVNNRVEVDGDSYVSSVALNENETIINGKAEHHSGDLYVWDSNNTKQETLSLDSYKVWRDQGTSSLVTARPDVSFDVYRVSYAENPEIEAAVELGDKVGLTEVISQYANTDHSVVHDRFWNTTYNDWCWGCDLGEVERYDADGYPYVYFLVERYTSSRGVYVEGYDNETGKVPNIDSDVTSTREVFDTPSEDLSTTCLVLADGATSQYSKTTVNYRYDTRTVSGRKIWHVMPSLLDIPDVNKPAVTVNLYRSSVSIPELEYGTYAQDLLETYKSELTFVNTATLNADGDGVYGFMFLSDEDYSPLLRYDEWGQEYHYYVFEDASTAQDLDSAYPSEATQITATDFHIVNVYSVNEPVEITINKTWQKNVAENPDQEPAAPAKFELYAQAVDSQGNKIGSEILMSTAIMKVDEDYESSFTFKYITEGEDANAEGFDGANYDTLPYYAANDIAYVYYVKEVSIPNGYISDWESLKGSSFENPVELTASATHTGSIGAGAKVLNEYGKSTSFKVSKTWNDDNAYGKDYRVPVTLTVSRSWAGNTVNGQYIEGGKDEVYCTVDLTEADLKAGTTNVWEKEITEVKGADGKTYKVQEYAPNASKYVYTVTEEKATNEDDQERLTTDYYFTPNGTAGTNTLRRVSSLSANKLFTWANNANISAADFAMLQSINAVPTAITFAVQRSDNSDGYQYVTSSGTRVDAYTGDNVLKKTINITANSRNTLKATWQNLPQTSVDGTTSYTYRVVEILTWKNADDTTNDTVWYSAENANNDTLQATDKNYAPEIGSVSVNKTGTVYMQQTYAFTNKIPTASIKLIKKWQGDNLNRDNTRPEKLYITATSKINKNYSRDFTLTKSATGTDEWTTTATLPKWDDSKYLSDVYTLSEEKGKNQKLFELYTFDYGVIDNDNLTYTVTNKLTDDDRKLVNVSATKTFSKDSDVKVVTQTRVQFKIYVQEKGGTDLTQITDENKGQYVGKEYVNSFECVQEVPITNNTGTVTWSGLNKYWELEASEAGDPQRIVYVIQEDLLDASGNILDTHSYKASANPKTPSTYTPYSEDNTVVEDVNAGTLTNELQTKSVQVTKSWANSRGDSFDAATVTDLVNKGSLPKSIMYGLQWYVDGAWAAVPGVVDKSFSTIELAKAGTTGVTWDAKVPQNDKSGNAIKYRVLEKSITYDGTNWTNVKQTGAFDGNVGAKDNGVYNVADFKANSSNVLSSGSISVSKKWEDEDNAYGDRTDVTINLYRDGALYDTQTLKANNNWTYTWANVPVYQSGTETYSTWSIEETPINGYDVTYDPTYANTGFTVGVAQTVTLSATNTLQRTSIPAMKQWEDNDNQDGKRPQSITFTVKGSVGSSIVYDGADKAGGTHVVTGSSVDNAGWSTPYTFENLPKYINGKLVTYTVDENTIGSYTDNKTLVNGTVVHTNNYTPEVVTINAEKTWAGDTGYEDVTRPASINYTVKGSYTKDDKVKTIDYGTMTGMKADGYHATMTDLPKYLEQGCEVTYTVEEIDIPGYTKGAMTQTKNGNTYTFSVTNTLKTTTAEADKTWDDKSNQDGKRPVSITYVLTATANGQTVGALCKTQTVTGSKTTDDNWYYKWEDLPTKAYVDKESYDVTYTVTEQLSAGTVYDLAKTETVGSKTTFTNHYTPEVTSVSAVKKWDGEVDALKALTRPDSITYKLTAKVDGQTVDALCKSATVAPDDKTADAGWGYTFEGLDKYHGGKLVAYSVTEVEVDGYATAVEQSADGATFTFTNKADYTYAEADKVWDDASNQDGKRPLELTYDLKAEITVAGQAVEFKALSDSYVAKGSNADNTGWYHKWENLPRYIYSNGTPHEVSYTVTETGYDPYTQTEVRVDGNKTTFTNHYTPETVKVLANKAWANEVDSLKGQTRPDSLTYTLTGTYTAGGEQRSYAPTEATKTARPADKSKDEGWGVEWAGLPKYAPGCQGAEISYDLAEAAVTGYATAKAGPAKSGTDSYGNTVFTVSFTNSLVTTGVDVEKVWNDDDDRDALRPGDIVVSLHANGADEAFLGKTAKLNGDSQWKATFAGLPKYLYEDGEAVEVAYTVSEDEVPDWYTAATTGTASEGYVVTNTHEPFTTEVLVEKAWEYGGVDESLIELVMPESITFDLTGKTADGATVYTDTCTVGADDNWAHTFKGLPAYAEGHVGEVITYTVAEEPVAGFDTDVASATAQKRSPAGVDEPGVLTYTYNFTNTLKTTTAEADKTWDDKSNQDGKRPVSITYVLTATANGQTVGALCKTQTVTGSKTTDDNWYYKWEDLPTKAYVDKESYDVTYTVTEQLSAGTVYDLAKTETVGSKTTFTNHYTPEVTSVSAVKKWDGEVDALKALTRPDSITYKLTAKVDGQTVDALCKSATVAPDDKTADAGWGYTFEGLDKYHGGKLVAYSVTEVEVDGYATAVEQSADGATFTFTNKADYTYAEADKVWDDASNQDGKRPLELTYDLKAEITVAGQAVEFKALSDSYVAKGSNADNTGWYHKWENLPRYIYSNGTPHEVSYTVTETGYDPYTQTEVRVDGNKTTFTNHYTPETVKVLANKAWANEVDSLKGQTRPDSLTYTLTGTYTAGGEQRSYAPTEATKTARPADKSKDEGWGVEWAGLPKYAPGCQGAEISYDLAEAAVTGYATAKAGPAKSGTDSYGNTVFTVSFTNSLVTTGVDVEKVWNDDDDRDALRPGDIVVSLHANGADEAFLGKTAKLNGDSQWKATFAGLPKYLYEDGEAVEVAYTVSEDEVPDWYTAATTGTASEGYVVTNTHEPFTTEVLVEKAWEYGGVDESLIELVMPESITFDLTGKTADGATVYTDTCTVGADDNWAHTFKGLPAYAEGHVGEVITYTVAEEPVAGFDTDVASATAQKRSPAGVDEPGVLTYTYNFTNTLQIVDVDITKDWEDDTDRDGLRPESIEIGLLESNEKFLDEGKQFTQTLSGSNEENAWSGSFTKLPKYLYENGVARIAEYSIEELTELPEYEVNIAKTGASSYAWTATNTHDPYLTTADVTKAWEDQDDLYGFRPGEITVTLIGTITIDASGDADISGDDYAIAPTPFSSVEKIVYQDQRTITSEDEWSAIFADLPVNAEHGTKITYKVFEDDVPGYEGDVEIGSYTDDEGFEHFTFDFDNTQIVTKVDAEKVWDDQNNVDKIRPSSITFVMTGKVTVDGLETTCVTLEKTVGAAQNWKASFENLPKYYTDGQEIVYTVTEKEIASGYTLKVTGDAETGFVLTNTHVPPSKTAKTGDGSAPLTAGLGMLGVLSMAALGFLRTRRKFEGRRARA